MLFWNAAAWALFLALFNHLLPSHSKWKPSMIEFFNEGLFFCGRVSDMRF
jgi:hypothetical protein